MRIDNTDLWSGLAGLALSVFVVWSSYMLGFGSISEPGSGYVTFYTGLLMMLFSLLIVAGAIMNDGPTFLSLWRDVLWTKPLIVIAALVAFALLFETLGFLLSTILLLILLLRTIDPVPWRRACSIAILVPLVAWYVLDKLLLIQLPAGIFQIG